MDKKPIVGTCTKYANWQHYNLVGAEHCVHLLITRTPLGWKFHRAEVINPRSAYKSGMTTPEMTAPEIVAWWRRGGMSAEATKAEIKAAIVILKNYAPSVAHALLTVDT